MYNGIGLTTPRGRYVFDRYLLKSASLNKLLLSAVQMVTSSAICPFCGPTTPKMTVLTLGILPRQSIANQTRRYLNTKENGRWRSSAWSFSLSWKIKSELPTLTMAYFLMARLASRKTRSSDRSPHCESVSYPCSLLQRPQNL